MDIQNFLRDRNNQLQKLDTQLNKAYWEFSINGNQENKDKLSRCSAKMADFLADREVFKQISHLVEQNIQDKTVHRQLIGFYNTSLKYQIDSELIEKMISLETSITAEFTNFRATYNNKKLSNNQITNILQTSLKHQERQTVYLASKQIGLKVAPLLSELVKIRNQAAQNLGFDNYYSLALKNSELDEKELFDILDNLKKNTDLPYKNAKKKVDQKLAKIFNLSPDDLMPWHYSDPFFQEPPVNDEVDLDSFIQNHDIVKLVQKYYQNINLDVKDIINRSDLYEREGKNQHAFCTHLNGEGDVRILCNLQNNEKWLNTLLHELGHGVYDKYLDFNLPFILRTPGHMFLTEAIALMFGNQSRNPHWLRDVVGIDPDLIQAMKNQLYWQEQLNLLIFIRWGLIMVYFERELYKNPDQDLNLLWWNLVEELQYLKHPGNRDGKADWAAKIHLGTFPVYYHNYILGYLAAYQIEAAIKEKLQIPYLYNDQRIGSFLMENIFKVGAKYHWNEILKNATGHKLVPDFAVRILG